MADEEPKPPRVLVTGTGYIAPAPFGEALAGQRTELPKTAPEITGFEVTEGAPAFGYEIVNFALEQYCPNLKTFVDRTSALALAAGKLALEDAGLLAPEARPEGLEIGCAYGSTMGCLEAMEIFWKKIKDSNPKFAQPLPFTHGYANAPSSLLAIEFGLRGSAATFGGERLAGIEALLFAHDRIVTGSASAVLVAASESLTRALHTHFHSESRLSPTGTAAPWHEDNDGIVPGEGAACLVLESEQSASARGRAALAEVTAIGLGSGSAVSPFLESWDRASEGALRGIDLAAGPALVLAATPEESSVDSWERAFWTRRLAKCPEVGAVAPKLFTGELLSASPLLGLVLGARILAGKIAGCGLPGAVALGAAATSKTPPPQGPFAHVFAGAIDPLAEAGIVTLRKA